MQRVSVWFLDCNSMPVLSENALLCYKKKKQTIKYLRFAGYYPTCRYMLEQVLTRSFVRVYVVFPVCLVDNRNKINQICFPSTAKPVLIEYQYFCH